MAGGLRLRSESTLISSLGTNYTVGGSPISIVPASQVQANQRVGIYKCIIEAIAATTIQFRGTDGTTLLSAQFSLGALGFFILDTPINGDPWWQAPSGQGIQLVLTGTGPVAADIWIGFGM